MSAGNRVTYPRIVEQLREAVKEKGQRAVSRESGIPLLSIQRYLKGESEPTGTTLQKLADYFGVTVEWLRGGAGKASQRLVSLLKNAVKEDLFEELEGEPPKPITIELLLQNEAEPNEETLQKLATIFDVSVPYLRGERVRTQDTDKEVKWLVEKGEAYLEMIELVPDRLKGFILEDIEVWQDMFADYVAKECADLTDSENKELEEIQDKAIAIIERAEKGDFPWYNSG